MSKIRRAIIVGGAGGIGAAISRRLASQGHPVIVADRDLNSAKEVVGTLDDGGHEAVWLDIGDSASIEGAFRVIEENDPAPILVFAAGGPVIRLDTPGDILTMDRAHFEKSLAVNVTGLFTTLQAFARLRVATPLADSRIVVIGSTVGEIAGSGVDIGYASAKASVIGLCREAAHALAPHAITVNTVAPGPVETPEFVRKTSEAIRAAIASSTLLKRLAAPDEVSAAVAYLVSPEAAYVTGAVLAVNGGRHMR